ncbi:MAG: dihydroorotate dehydrogenase-like protein [Calditrichia bacterium]
MDLSTTYMGLKLKNPLVVSSSPISGNVDKVRRLEDLGAAAVVMYSLFEEQINHEINEVDYYMSYHNESYAEAVTYLPEPKEYRNLHAEDYLKHIALLKEKVDIPIIGSLNGITPGGWTKYARKMEEAGADAIELNVYYIPTSLEMTSEAVENLYLESLKTVKEAVGIPVAMKLNPYFSAFANMASRLEKAGADGLVLFNRFYQPDIDLDNLEVVPDLKFSTEHEMRLPLRWLAILKGKVNASLAASTGIYHGTDVIKMLMAGADVTMLASVLFKDGISCVHNILENMKRWMEEKEYDSVETMKGSMSHRNIGDPAIYVRANYIKTLQSIK